MPHLENSKRYQAKEDVFFGDGREIELLHYVYSRDDIDIIRGSPERVLDVIDGFARRRKYLMNVGDDKGKKVCALIAEIRPKVMVEMGGYVAYSTILFADAMKKAGGFQYFTLERNAEFAAVIMSLVDLAGLSDLVKVVVGSCDASIRRLTSIGTFTKIDMMFLDHYKPAYTTDLKLCEDLNLIQPGSVIAADNVIAPGNPPYLEYVRSSVEAKRAAADIVRINNKDDSSKFQQHTVNQYAQQKWSTETPLNIVGNPNLIYESHLIPGFEPSGEPDGVEVSRCVGVENEASI